MALLFVEIQLYTYLTSIIIVIVFYIPLLNFLLFLDIYLLFQYIRKLVQNALTQATSDGHTSIALPALGTGLMKVPLNLSAQWMFTEVEAFSKMNTSKSVMDVRFVVYPTEKHTVDVSTHGVLSLIFLKNK